MIIIDGSQGEGGGQVLRTALSLSVITGSPFHIVNIRSNRKEPGLKAQHLKAVDAMAAISRAQVEGGSLHSTELTFTPGNIRTGRYRFEIGTAGSTSLVLQTLYLPLCLADSASTVLLIGGTHVPWAPCFHYLEQHWLSFLKLMGIDLDLRLELAGFYPQGGGRIATTIRSANNLSPLIFTERGELLRIRGISAVSNLDLSIANRQKRRALQRLEGYASGIKISTINMPSKYKGTMLLLIAEFRNNESSHTQCCYYSLGALGKPAEQVADEAVEMLDNFLQSSGAIDQYLADQLLLPLVFSQGISKLRTSKLTSHLFTNANIISQFTSAKIDITGQLDESGLIKITPVEYQDKL